MDEEGFLYFIGRRDKIMKPSGYRVSPAEVEEVLHATRPVGECVAFGAEHASLGQAIQIIATPPAGASATLDVAVLLAECRQRMRAYMVPSSVEVVSGPLPDLLANRMELPDTEVGGLVVASQSGAYGASASPQSSLGHPACVEVLV